MSLAIKSEMSSVDAPDCAEMKTEPEKTVAKRRIDNAELARCKRVRVVINPLAESEIRDWIHGGDPRHENEGDTKPQSLGAATASESGPRKRRRRLMNDHVDEVALDRQLRASQADQRRILTNAKNNIRKERSRAEELERTVTEMRRHLDEKDVELKAKDEAVEREVTAVKLQHEMELKSKEEAAEEAEALLESYVVKFGEMSKKAEIQNVNLRAQEEKSLALEREMRAQKESHEHELEKWAEQMDEMKRLHAEEIEAIGTRSVAALNAKKNEELKMKNVKMQGELMKLKEETAKRDEELHATNEKLLEMSFELQANEEKNRKLQEENGGLVEKAVEMDAKLKLSREKNDALEKQVEEKKEQLVQLEVQLEAKGALVAHYEKRRRQEMRAQTKTETSAADATSDPPASAAEEDTADRVGETLDGGRIEAREDVDLVENARLKQEK